MSLTTLECAIIYEGNGSTVTAYPVPFRFLETDHIKVAVQAEDEEEPTLLESADYTVVQHEDGEGEVTTETAYPDTTAVTIFREIPLEQPTSYPTGGPFPASSHEQALDRITMILQQQNRKILQALGLDDSSIIIVPGSDLEALRDVVSWADSAVRGAVTPKRIGQLGVQIDDSSIWVAGSTSVGDWDPGVSRGAVASWAASGDLSAVTPSFVGQLGVQTDDKRLFIGTATSAGAWAELTQFSFADAAARALKAPVRVGQIAVQLDDNSLWIATGTSAGNWTEAASHVITHRLQFFLETTGDDATAVPGRPDRPYSTLQAAWDAMLVAIAGEATGAGVALVAGAGEHGPANVAYSESVGKSVILRGAGNEATILNLNLTGGTNVWSDGSCLLRVDPNDKNFFGDTVYLDYDGGAGDHFDNLTLVNSRAISPVVADTYNLTNCQMAGIGWPSAGGTLTATECTLPAIGDPDYPGTVILTRCRAAFVSPAVINSLSLIGTLLTGNTSITECTSLTSLDSSADGNFAVANAEADAVTINTDGLNVRGNFSFIASTASAAGSVIRGLAAREVNLEFTGADTIKIVNPCWTGTGYTLDDVLVTYKIHGGAIPTGGNGGAATEALDTNINLIT